MSESAAFPSRVQVAVVGAGLAGLSAAVRLVEAGCDVHVLEASDGAGGRLATEVVDGFVVDRGFQVLNTGYPRVVDPRSAPGAVADTLRTPVGSLVEKAAVAAFSVRAGY